MRFRASGSLGFRIVQLHVASEPYDSTLRARLQQGCQQLAPDLDSLAYMLQTAAENKSSENPEITKTCMGPWVYSLVIAGASPDPDCKGLALRHDVRMSKQLCILMCACASET